MLTESLSIELNQIESQSISLLREFQSAQEEKSEIKERANILQRAHSNSLFGDHAFTYYRGFRPPPSGFDVEWGHLIGYRGKHNEDWEIHSLEELSKFVFGESSFDDFKEQNRRLKSSSVELRDRAFDLFAIIAETNSGSLASLASTVQADVSAVWEFASHQKFLKNAVSSAPKMTRDSSNISQGMRIPLHLAVFAELNFLSQRADALSIIANSARRIHTMSKLALPHTMEDTMPANIFIGHGRSPLWRELQAYFEKELGLVTEEFNSEPVAGLSTQSRLDQMLNNSAMAFLVMTAEDEISDGTLRARENVIHEVGLFQGRLGWSKALVLLEDGCSEFSNLHGVNHIPFNKGSIKDTFVDIRRALVREGLLSS